MVSLITYVQWDNIQTVNISQSQPYELDTFNIFIPINIKNITNDYELGSNQPW